MRNKLLNTMLQFRLNLAVALGMLDLNANTYNNILVKRQNTIAKLDQKLLSCGDSLKEFQSQLLTLKPSDKSFKKSFASIQESLISLQAYIEKASLLKSKLEGSLERLSTKSLNSNKFLNYTWSTKDRGSGMKSRLPHLPEAISLRDMLLACDNIIDSIAVENTLDSWEVLPEHEKAWAFGTVDDYHCNQKGSNRYTTPFKEETSSQVYARYKKPLAEQMVLFNAYQKPLEEE